MAKVITSRPPASKTLTALAGVVALQGQADLHDAPPQQDKTHRADQRKDERGEVLDHDQRVICGKGGQGKSCCYQRLP